MTATRSWLFLTGLCLALCLNPLAHAADAMRVSPEQLASIQFAVSRLIRQEMDAKEVPGLSIALVEDQKILWAQGFGFADRARRLPARADTLYSVGGLSMLLTAAAAMQFTESGDLRLDQPVTRYLPDFAMRTRFAGSAAITPRLLLTHHAGLPAMHFRNMWTPQPESLNSFVARLNNEYVASPPGQVYSPSFPGYDVLGRVLELLCHREFSACLRERLLTPLGMHDSTFDVASADPARLATHYWNDRPVSSVTVRDVPAAGLVSSVNDLAQFTRMLLADGNLDGQQILRPHSVREMLRVQNKAVALDFDLRIGLGWRLSGVSVAQARRVAWLSNDSPFGRGRLLLVPQHKLGVIVLTNSSGSTEAVEHVSERLLELVLQDRAPVAAESRPVLSAATAAPSRSDIVGHYATSLGLITVRHDGHDYRAQMFGKTLSLQPQPEGLLAPEYRLLGLVPIPISVLKETRLTMTDTDARHVAVVYYRHQAYRLGTRIETVSLSSAWRQRLGEYQAVERDPLLDLVKLGTVTLAYDDGLLYFRYRVPGWIGLIAKVAVTPVNDTELVVAGTGWLMGETVQVVQREHQEVLRYSGYEFRRRAGVRRQ